MCTNKPALTAADIEAKFPKALAYKIMSASSAIVEDYSEKVYNVLMTADGVEVRPRPDVASFDKFVKLWEQSTEPADDDEEEPVYLCDSCGEEDYERHEWCDDCDRCDRLCDCPPYDPIKEHGTYWGKP